MTISAEDVTLAYQFGFDFVFDKLNGRNVEFKRRYLLRSSSDKSVDELARIAPWKTPIMDAV